MSYILQYSSWKKLNEAANGELPSSELRKIPVLPGESERHSLNPVAAKAYSEMVAAAKADGVEWGITDSYRTLEVQKQLVKKKGLYSQGGLAAKPGTSNHGWGSAVDLNFKKGKGDPLKWLRNNASRFGFTNIPREPWHWEHKESAKLVKAGTIPATGDLPIVPAAPEPTPATPVTTTPAPSGADSGQIYSVKGDPYQYKIINGQWWSKGPKLSDWTSLETNTKAINILDARHPGARSGTSASTGSEKTNTILPATPKPSQSTGVDVILMGGLDYRAGDKKIDEQIQVLSKGLGGTKKVIGFRYNEPSAVLAAISQHPNAKVVLFSAGGAYSKTVAEAMKNKSNLYIVEPYAASSATKSLVQAAVSLGVPSANVVAGPNKSRGDGAVSGATRTPGSVNHWGALEWVGTIIK